MIEGPSAEMLSIEHGLRRLAITLAGDLTSPSSNAHDRAIVILELERIRAKRLLLWTIIPMIWHWERKP